MDPQYEKIAHRWFVPKHVTVSRTFLQKEFSSDQPCLDYKNNTLGKGKGEASKAQSAQRLSYENDDRSNGVRCTRAKLLVSIASDRLWGHVNFPILWVPWAVLQMLERPWREANP